MEMKNKYVSLFKIDGVPILPPLMTKEKRQEMQSYRELAMAIETKLRVERGEGEYNENANLPKVNTLKKVETDQESDEAATIHEDEYLKVSNLINKSMKLMKLQQPQEQQEKKNEKDFLQYLNRSDLFICDVTRNQLMIPSVKTQDTFDAISLEKSIENDENNQTKSGNNSCAKEISAVNEKRKITTASPSKQSIIMNKTIIKIDENRKSQKLIPKSSSIGNGIKSFEVKSNVPLISVMPPSPKKNIVSAKKSLDTETKTSINKSKLNNTENQSQTTFIRSNSFTLDSPSEVLIDHIVKCKKEELEKASQKHSENQIEHNDNSNKNIDKSPKHKLNQKCLRNPSIEPKLGLVLSPILAFKNKRSPYDSRLNGRVKTSRRQKNSLHKTSSVSSLKRKTRSPTNSNKDSCFEIKEISNNDNDNQLQQIKELIEDIENKHQLKIKKLLERQHEEQKIMQEHFEKQQKLLLEKFTLNNNNNKNVPSGLKSAWVDEINSIRTETSSDRTIDSPITSPISSIKSSGSKKESSFYLQSPDYNKLDVISPKINNRRAYSIDSSIADASKLFGSLNQHKKVSFQ